MKSRTNAVLLDAADQAKAALFSTESHIDLAIAGVAATMLRLGSDRERSGLSIFHTQTVLEDAARLASKMIETRGDLGRFHNRMAAAARMAGLDQVAIGPTFKPGGSLEPMDETEEAVEISQPELTGR